MAGDEAILWTVTLVVNNLRTHIETLHDLEEALHHAVSAEGAGEVGRGVLAITDREQVRQEVGEAGVELLGEDDITGHHDVYPG